MKKDKLTSYCMLPVDDVVVEGQPNKIYWKWCDMDGKIQEGKAQNKRGIWKLYVDVKHGDGPVNVFKTDPTEKAWDALYDTAIKNGYNETGELYADKIKIERQDGFLEMVCRQLIQGDDFSPQLMFDFQGEDANIKITLDLSLDDLTKLAEMLSDSAARISEAN